MRLVEHEKFSKSTRKYNGVKCGEPMTKSCWKPDLITIIVKTIITTKRIISPMYCLSETNVELPTLPEHLGLPPVFSGVPVAQL